MYHTLFHILAIHICTFALFLHIGDEGACAAEHREWERKSKPERVGEDSVGKAKYDEWCRKNAHCLPDLVVVHLWGFRMGCCQASCMGHQASHESSQGVAVASAAADIREVVAHGSATCRGARRESKADRWDWKPQCLDLQALRS